MERSVGIRNLRDRLTRYLASVRRGGQLVITDRGQPVAVLSPYRRRGRSTREDRLKTLLSSGHVAPAERPFLKNPPLGKGRGPLLSDLIAEDRR